ncbi:hypothetical protein ACROYT_G035192 [Oculina patagonica]
MSDVPSPANAELSAQLSQDEFEMPSFDLFRGSFFPEPPAKRFASFSESELEQLVSERHSKKTKEVTNWSVTTFKAWCAEKNIQTPLEAMTMGQLDENLRRFYAEARTKKGEEYSKSTLLGFRHSVERFLNAPPNNRGLQISTDPRFARSNLMLDAQIKNLKRSGKENVTHKPAIERGREGQRSLTTKSFKFESDAAGRNYATMSHDELSKNHPGGLKDVESTEKEARMYETEDQGDGYKALKLYLQKVNPNCTAFFQYPKKNCRAEDAVWYEAHPLGMNSLAKMMKIISEEASLSKIYTNHCVRATAITLWSNAGISNRHIMAISGHRSEQSLVSYNSRPSTSQLHNCSQVLSKAFSASTNNQSHPKEVSQFQQLSMFQTKQVAPKSLFSDCSVQNVQIVFNGSSSGFQSIFK